MSARPSPPADSSQPLRGTALFVHGLWLSGAESFLIRRRLSQRGVALRVLPYSSLTESMDTVARRVARYATALAGRTQQPVHLVGHSLGGLVIHRTFELDLLTPDRFSGDFCRVVLLGSPLRGSQSARAVSGYRAVRGLLGKVGSTSLQRGVAGPWVFPAQLGIIAGDMPIGVGRLLRPFDGPNDGTVAVAETHLEGATDHCVLRVSHTGMWFSTEVVTKLANFLDYGRF